MSSIEQISSSLPSGSSTTSSSKSTSLGWRLVLALWWLARWVPWYLWLMVGIWAYANYGRGGLTPKPKPRRTVQSNANSAGTPRRPTLTPRQPARPASPFTGINRASPQLSRRSSYARLPASEIRQTSSDRPQEMQERRTESQGHPPLARSSVSSPQSGARSTSSLPRLSSAGLPLPRSTSFSSLRHQISASAPTLPSSARKRGRGDDEEPEVKRSKLSESYHFDDTDEDGEGASAMELDDFAASKPSRGQKRGGGDIDDEAEDAKRSRTTEPSESDVEEQQQPAARKRHAAGSPSASDEENWNERQASHKGKKARRSARGVGSVRDKRPIEDVSPEESEGEEYGYDSEGAARFSRASTRNADSDVSEDEGAEESAAEQPEAARRAPATVKRFRERARREGSADDDMMGDDLDSASRDAFSPAPSSGTPQKKRLSTAASAKKRLSSKSASASRKSSSIRSAVDAKLAAASRKPDTPRKVGDEWTNYEGDRYKIDEDGVQRRLVEVRETRLKYKMPKDSRHPDAKATHEVVVERWVTAEEYDALFEQRKLAWQHSREEEERDRRAAEQAGEADTSMADANASPQPASKERGIYFATGVGTPLRSYSGLGSRLPSSSSLNSLAKLSNSPSSYPTLPNGRMRLPSSASGSALAALAAGSPRRKWSVNDVKRLLEDEDAAKAEREKRRKAAISVGGGDEADAEAPKGDTAPTKPTTNETEGKIKLADYALPASSVDAAAGEKAQSTPSSTSAPPGAASADAAGPPSAAPSLKPTGVPNFFGTALGSAAKETPTKSEAAALTAPKPLFSFGATPASTPSADASPEKIEPAPKPAFGAAAAAPAPPAPAENKTDKPLFSFGNTTSASATSDAPKSTTSLFGAPVSTDAPAEKKAQAPAQSATPSLFGGFGAPPTSASPAPGPTATAEASKAPFSFASAPIPATSAPEPAPAAPAGGFSFGSTPSAPTERKEDAPAKPSFSFGTASTPATAQPTPAPSFGFGASAAPPAKSDDKPAAASPFSFGSTPAQTDKPMTPAFGFGAPHNGTSDSKTGAAPATAPAQGGFSFGAPAANTNTSSAPSSGFSFGGATSASPAPSSTGFSFGTASPAAAPSTGFSFGTAAPAPSSGFNFGAPTAATTPGVSPSTGTFNFGASAPTSPGAQSAGGTPMFSLGSGGGETATTPRRRPVRRLPGR